MYSELELQVIKDMCIPGFGGKLAALYLQYDRFHILSERNLLPSHDLVLEFYSLIDKNVLRFNEVYFSRLPRAPINPLHKEQKAWILLSPIITGHQNQYAHIPLIYPANPNKHITKLHEYIEGTIPLLEKWAIIGASYSSKYDLTLHKDHAELFKSITDDMRMQYISGFENKVDELIKELSA